MGDNTHIVTVSSVEDSDTAQIHVPAEAVREEGVSIDDTLRVVINGLSGFINSAEFTNALTSGDRVTVPAEFVREVGVETGEQYPVEFENLEQSTESGSIVDREEETAPVEESETEESESEERELGSLFS